MHHWPSKWPTKLETPCFWYQFLVSGVRNLDTSFLWPVSGTRNLGGELGSCAITAMGLTLSVSCCSPCLAAGRHRCGLITQWTLSGLHYWLKDIYFRAFFVLIRFLMNKISQTSAMQINSRFNLIFGDWTFCINFQFTFSIRLKFIGLGF